MAAGVKLHKYKTHKRHVENHSTQNINWKRILLKYPNRNDDHTQAGTYSANLFVEKTVYTILKPISCYKFQDKDLKPKFLDEVYNKSLAITAQNSAEIYHNKAKLTVITYNYVKISVRVR